MKYEIILSSEDDPERLWCICKQPHNNRFMICCDNCLDWYHGKCVGITKRMGKEREDFSLLSLTRFHGLAANVSIFLLSWIQIVG